MIIQYEGHYNLRFRNLINWKFISAVLLLLVVFLGVYYLIDKPITLETSSFTDVPPQSRSPEETSSFQKPTEETPSLVIPTSNVIPTSDETLETTPTDSGKQLGKTGTFLQGSKVEINLIGSSATGMSMSSNPFQIEVDVTFSGPSGQTYIVPAFYDGDGVGGLDGDIWKVRFLPDAKGIWNFVSSSPDMKLNGYEGEFEVNSSPQCQAGEPEQSLDLGCLGTLEHVGGHYLRFNNGEYWIKGGIDDPENILGEALGDWEAKKSAIDYLSSKGVNSIYVITNNIDGDRNDTWPWVGDTPQEAKANSDRFNVAKLQRWEEFFSYVQSKGIILHIVLNDDSAWHGYDHDLYFREMIARFSHHPGLYWNVGEEANEIYSNDEQVKLAGKLQDMDPYNHPVTVHRVPIWPFLGNSNFDLASIQPIDGGRDFSSTNLRNQNSVVITHREKSVETCYPIPIMIDELPRVTQVNETARYKMRAEVLYPIFLGGGHFELHFKDAYGQGGNVTFQDLGPMLDDMRLARQFLEGLPFPEMQPCNELISGQRNYCFGKDGEVYAIYLPIGREVAVDLTGSNGNYNVAWFNPRTGELTEADSIPGGSVWTFIPPDDNDWVLKLYTPISQVTIGNLNGEFEVINFTDTMLPFSFYLPTVMQCGG